MPLDAEEFEATPFADLAVEPEQFLPEGISQTTVENDILGVDDDETVQGNEDLDWDGYRDGHLAYAPDPQRGGDPPKQKNAYKLIIAGRHPDGDVRVDLRTLSRAIAHINGARGGVNLTEETARAAYDHAMQYYDKLGIDEDERPEFDFQRGTGMPPVTREAIGEHDTEVVDRSWDGQSAESSISNDVGEDVLRTYYAWRDEDEDPDTKSAYSFIHHHSEDGEAGAANLTACQTGIGILNGGRGVDPDEQPWGDDRQGIWDHLAAHIRDADEEPPELSSQTTVENFRTPSDVTKTRNQYQKKVQHVEGPERRAYNMIEVRADDGESRQIDGHAAVFDQVTTIQGFFGAFKEVIRDTAFDRVLADEQDTRALVNHDPNQVLGRVGNDTLELKKTNEGLRYINDLPDTTYANDAFEVIKRGDMDKSSFGFSVEEENWTEDEDGTPLREILEVEHLRDVSPVTFPAYNGSSVGVRAELQSVHRQTGVNIERLSQLLLDLEYGERSQEALNEIQSIINQLQHRADNESKNENEVSVDPELYVYLTKRKIELEA